MKKIIIFLIVLLNFSFLHADYKRIVSISPTITQIIFALGAGDKVVGVTYHDTYPFEATKKTIVGGFFAPDIKRIEKLKPDLIFCAKFHKDVISHFKNKVRVIVLQAHSVNDIYKNIEFLGKLLGKEKSAKRLIEKMHNEIALIQEKLKFIPENKRRRVIRVMGPGFVPGRNSFQIDVIKKAGGIPFVPEVNGDIYKISLKEWKKFNPDFIYVCGNDRNYLKNFFTQPGWKDVNAVKNHKIYTFPCILTCRASELTGYFIQWLSASIYNDYFFNEKNIITKHKITKRKKLKNYFDYVKNVELVSGIINDFPHKTLLIEFKKPQKVLSTLDGFRKVKFIGNHYLVPPRWNEGHKNFKKFKKEVAEALGVTLKNSSLLYTGANMDNLAIKFKKYKDIKIAVYVTAGVNSNALRIGKYSGIFINHGTINIIVLTNLKLTQRAMARSIITVTEAKTSALQDLDIRSSYNRAKFQATGTGTDNIIIVSGNGRLKDIAGGHTKFAEILAKCVYEGVKEAILKQNRIVANRNIFQRLKERNVRLFELAKIIKKYKPEITLKQAMLKLDDILLDPLYSNYLKGCFSINDDYERRLVGKTFILNESKFVAEKISGKKLKNVPDLKETNYPFILDRCIDSILYGIIERWLLKL